MHIIELVPPREPLNLPKYYERISSIINTTKRVSIASKPSGQSISGFDKSINLIKFLQAKQCDLNILFHVTCRDLNKRNIEGRLGVLRDMNVRDILVVSGDGYEKALNDEVSFEDSKHLLGIISRDYKHWFSSIAVAGYPGGNGRSSLDNRSECRRLAGAIELGADAIFTQCIFEAETFNEFRFELEKSHAQVRVIPSVALFRSAQDLERIIRSTRVSNSTVNGLINQLKSMDDQDTESYCLDFLLRLYNNLSASVIDICAFNRYEIAERLISKLEQQ